MIRGRPIRFVAIVLGGWTALRLAMVLAMPLDDPDDPVQMAARGPMAERSVLKRVPTIAATKAVLHDAPVSQRLHYPVNGMSSFMVTQGRYVAASEGPVAGAMPAPWPAAANSPNVRLVPLAFAFGAGLAPVEATLPQASGTRRWSGSAWTLWRRDGDAVSLARDTRLGASQTGVRIDYTLDPDGPLRPALYGRVSSALSGIAAAEGAVGVALRPRLALPVIVAVERRVALSRGGRNDFALLVAGGINPLPVGGGFHLDGYGQAGFVGTRRPDAFIDGRLSLERSMPGMPELAIGAGLWGGAQPGVSRLDIGPQASLRLRLGGASFRLGAEWRQQVAGQAAPSSGPAFSIGTDF